MKFSISRTFIALFLWMIALTSCSIESDLRGIRNTLQAICLTHGGRGYDCITVP